jgi:hypothetical protein
MGDWAVPIVLRCCKVEMIASSPISTITATATTTARPGKRAGHRPTNAHHKTQDPQKAANGKSFC